jgi:hypothetical protein
MKEFIHKHADIILLFVILFAFFMACLAFVETT